MDRITQLIQDAAKQVLPHLSDDELCRRLARRNTNTLRRPPRAWRVAVRASDTRINPWNAAIVPEDAMDPSDLDHAGRCLPHMVTLDKRMLVKLCERVHVESSSCILSPPRLRTRKGRPKDVIGT